MKRVGKIGIAAALLLGLVFVLSLFVTTCGASAQEASRVALAPVPPKAQRGPCVADTDTMRRDHMTMLKHQRDATVHGGVRGKPEGLTNCIECHAVKGADGKFVKYDSPKHFCRGCHDYAAVAVDCFQCHASRPEAKTGTANAAKGRHDLAAAMRFLQEKHP
jgi:predicted CXXCH cytochrome family protein